MILEIDTPETLVFFTRSTICLTLPAPPCAITGIDTDFDILFIVFISNPLFKPS